MISPSMRKPWHCLLALWIAVLVWVGAVSFAHAAGSDARGAVQGAGVGAVGGEGVGGWSQSVGTLEKVAERVGDDVVDSGGEEAEDASDVAESVGEEPPQREISREITFYTGVSRTAPTTITIEQEGYEKTAIENVRFVNKPFVPPPYYGIRYRWEWPSSFVQLDRVGLELEFVHFKIYYESGDDPDDIIQRFDVTDGLNLFYVNGVGAKRIGEDLYLSGRIGVGPVIAHPETEIRHQKKGRDGDWGGFEYSGLAWQGSLALEKALEWPLGIFDGSKVFVEYKYTSAKPTISIVGGSATTTTNAHHFVIGWSLRH